jgi:hypothetical protein
MVARMGKNWGMEMATQTIITVTDDLDGSTEDVSTISFMIDGTPFEIDLSGTNRDAFRAKLAPFIEAARPAGRHLASVPPVRKARTGRQAADRADVAGKREWLAANGFPEVVGRRGRFSADEEAAYTSRTPRVREADVVEVVEVPTATVRTKIKKLTPHNIAAIQECFPDAETGGTFAILPGTTEDIRAAVQKVMDGIAHKRGNALYASLVTLRLKVTEPERIEKFTETVEVSEGDAATA